MSRRLTSQSPPYSFNPRHFLLPFIPEDQELSDLDVDPEYREICVVADHLTKRLRRLEQRDTTPSKLRPNTHSPLAQVPEDGHAVHGEQSSSRFVQTNTSPEASSAGHASPEPTKRGHRHRHRPRHRRWRQRSLQAASPDKPYQGPHPNTGTVKSDHQSRCKSTSPVNTSQDQALLMDPSGMADKRLGDTNCTACVSRPTHKIVPCQHPLCYDHLLVGHDEESTVTSVCARCSQTVIKVVELSDHVRSSSTSLSPLTVSPNTKNIWSPTNSHSLPYSHSLPSLSERVSVMNQPSEDSTPWPVPEFVPETQQQSMAGAPQHHHGHESATQHNRRDFQEPATQPLDNPAIDKQPGINTDAKQPDMNKRVKTNNDNRQHPSQQRVPGLYHHGQQSAMGQHYRGQQPIMSQHYPTQQPIMGQSPHYAIQQPITNRGPQYQYPVQQTAMNNYYGPPPPSPYPAHQPNVNNNYYAPPGHQMNVYTGPPLPAMAYPQSAHDPFIDNNPMRQLPHGFAPPSPSPAMYNRGGVVPATAPHVPMYSRGGVVPATAPPVAMYNRGGGFTTAAPPVSTHNRDARATPASLATSPPPAQGNQQRSEAFRLAQAIKSGVYEESDDNRGNRGHESFATPQTSRRTTSEWALQQPIHQPVRPIVRQNFDMPDLVPDPPFFGALARGHRPTYPEALEFMPFTEQYKNIQQRDLGVIKILNIPYGTTKNEIVAAVGRNARLINQPAGTPYYAIHIIMERSTGKTMDCFVELASHIEATTTVNNFHQRCMSGRQPRIGDRHVELELSSQEALMKELFPRARCVKWNGTVPTVYETDEPFNSGFNGYLTGEEMVMVQKHAETPQRSPFAQRCNNRTYECLISTLHKYPWSAIDSVTIGERDLLFNCSVGCLRALMKVIPKINCPSSLTRQLLQELLCATLVTNGFNPRQKSFICDLVEQSGFPEVIGSVSYTSLGSIGSFWPFEVLDKKPGVSIGVLQFYVDILREGSMTAEEFQQLGVYGYDPADGPFGKITVNYGSDKRELTVKHAAMLEWNILESAIRKALSSEEQQAAITSG